MSDHPWNDWRVTAYVLGELDEQTRCAFERELAADPRLRDAVAEAQRITRAVTDSLGREPAPTLSDDRRAEIFSHFSGEPPMNTPAPTSQEAKMPLQKPALAFVCGLSLALATALPAAIFSSDTGDWPRDWPEELEPFRQQAKTVGVATGVQENIYVIPFDDRDAFERIWPVILKVRTPGSPLRLYRTSGEQSAVPQLSRAKPSVQIYAPSESYLGGMSPEEYRQRDELLRSGRLLHASAPWPEELTGEDGSLPEYVVAVKDEDGRLRWEPGMPGDEHKGFYHRARVDITLVVDGEVIDLNRIRFPENVELIDRR